MDVYADFISHIVNRITMNMNEQISLKNNTEQNIVLWECAQCWVGGPYTSSIFGFLRNSHTAFYNESISLHSHQQ